MTSPSTPTRVALITGSTSGIGLEIARTLHAQGYGVVVTGRSKARGDQIVEQLNADGAGRAVFVRADLLAREERELLVRTSVEHFGRLDVLVNNAAVDHVGPLLDVPVEEIQATFETNAVAAIAMLQAAARVMVAAGGGSIINIVSRLASAGVATLGIYSASKGAMVSITRSAAIELAPHNVRVNSVAPGVTRTSMLEEWLSSFDEPEAGKAELAGAIPLGRIAEPADVANAVAFLASEASAYLTGINVPVDGGYLAK